MPGMICLKAAAAVTDDWTFPTGGLPLIVFVTADQYALQALSAQAVDYVLGRCRPNAWRTPFSACGSASVPSAA